MQANRTKIRELLRAFKFPELLRDELGWDNLVQDIPTVSHEGKEYTIKPVAHKRGVQVFVCMSQTGELPDYPTRKAIETKVRKFAHEHLIIFVDQDKTVQRWQWVRREPNKPIQVREYHFDHSKSGELLVQRLAELVFSLEEEERLTLVDVTNRMNISLYKDKVTKKFYSEFKKQRDAFAKFLKGIPTDDMQSWYVSVMLNRLMFIYFIQKKGFLNDDQNYLKVKLAESKTKGKDLYFSDFLCPLFFEGFAKKSEERTTEHKKLLGDIPYLNGGLFLKHQIEESHGETIEICDKAFEHIFEFFDCYNWHLDERPLKNEDEINPEVLGFIFEKYINQKQMGAYYTKEDITGYITKNTVIPYLFDAAGKECKIAFEGDHAVWQLLKKDPDAYIYAAMRRGVENPLPPEIEAGIADVSKRTQWNKPADDALALPTEIWREVVARRQRYQEVKAKLAAGEVQSINDLITYNLDIRQFAQDVIENCEGPDLLRAFWKAISSITVLDPTCGSGAFLFAALNILEPLYEACLDRMQGFLDDLEQSGKKHSPDKFKDFRETLDRINVHANRNYFVFKSIIVNNLYGVDIMEEAVEICKLRLFLKLVAQVEDKNKIEPLPDIDFNIRPGNTLVGFSNFKDVERATEGNLVKQLALPMIKEKAEDVGRYCQHFRDQQTSLGGEVTLDDKHGLRALLESLEAELNEFLAESYGIDFHSADDYASWKDSHKPFHWYTEFFDIIDRGGFDVVIGNPPYVELSKLSEYKVTGFESQTTGDLYSLVMERSLALCYSTGHLGFIVPMSFFTVDSFKPIQDLYRSSTSLMYVSSWSGDAHPSKLFEGVNKRLQIVLAQKSTRNRNVELFSTKYYKWYAVERPVLFDTVPWYCKVDVSQFVFPSSLPKIGTAQEFEILETISRTNGLTVGSLIRDSGIHFLYYTRKVSFFLQFLTFIPTVRDSKGKQREPSELKALRFDSENTRNVCLSSLSSSLFYWFNTMTSDCRNLNKREITAFPVPSSFSDEEVSRIQEATRRLMDDYVRNSSVRSVTYAGVGKVSVQYFNFRLSKHIIDEIDEIVLQKYGLSIKEIDLILNYDIKYRMGQSLEEDDD